MASTEQLIKEAVLTPALANAALLIAAPSLGCLNTYTKAFTDLCRAYGLHVPDLAHILQYSPMPLPSSSIRSLKTQGFSKTTQVLSPEFQEPNAGQLEIKTEPEDLECDALTVKCESTNNTALYNVCIYDTKPSSQGNSLEQHVKNENTQLEIPIDITLEIPLKRKTKSDVSHAKPSTLGTSLDKHVKNENTQLEIPIDITLPLKNTFKKPLKRKAKSEVSHAKPSTLDTSLEKHLKVKDIQLEIPIDIALEMPLKRNAESKVMALPSSSIRSLKTQGFSKTTQVLSPDFQEPNAGQLEIKTEPEDLKCDALTVKNEITNNSALYNECIYDTKPSSQDNSLEQHVKNENTQLEIPIDITLEIPLKRKAKSDVSHAKPSTLGTSLDKHVKNENTQLEIPFDITLPKINTFKIPKKRKAMSEVSHANPSTLDTSLEKHSKVEGIQLEIPMDIALEMPLKRKAESKVSHTKHSTQGTSLKKLVRQKESRRNQFLARIQPPPPLMKLNCEGQHESFHPYHHRQPEYKVNPSRAPGMGLGHRQFPYEPNYPRNRR